MTNCENMEIIAVDFDGTLCIDCYPHIGEPNIALIQKLRQWKLQEKKLILWTCRNGQPLNEAVSWCATHGLIFDAINENIPEIIEKYGSDSRKITADIYIDDRSILPWQPDLYTQMVV